MKKLNEELHKLDEYNFNVSPDFSKKVMKKIRRGHITNRLQYVVSLASLAAVACFAVVICKDSSVLNRVLGENQQKENMASFYDIIIPSSQDDVSKNSFNEIKEEDKDSNNIQMEGVEYDKNLSVGANNLLEQPNNTNMVKEEIRNETDSKIEDLNVIDSSRIQYEEKIIQIIKDAKFSVEKVAEGLKVNAKKQEIKELLKNENVEIEELKDGVLVKVL